MKLALTIAFAALMLAGPASGYDKSAVPTASAAMRQASLDCKARHGAKELKSYSEWQDCQLMAERTFVMAVDIKMDAFDEYASGMKALAADMDANRMTAKQVRSRAGAILDTFLADCGCRPARVFAGGGRGYGWQADHNLPNPYAVPSGAAAGASGGHPTPPPASPP